MNFDYDVTESAPYGLCDKITFKGSAGQDRVIRISKDYSLNNLLRTTQTSDPTSVPTVADLFNDQPNDDVFYSNGTSTIDAGPGIKAVWLPDGRSYLFKYSVYGRLARVVLPTGGAVEYDYVPISPIGPLGTIPPSVQHRVSQKRIYDESNNLVGKTVFSLGDPCDGFPGGNCGTSVIVEQFDSANALQTKEKHYFRSGPGGDFPYNLRWDDGKEFKSEMFATNGTTLLVRTEVDWRQRVPSWCYSNPYITNICGLNPSVTMPHVNSFAAATTTTLADANLVSKVTSIDPSTGDLAFDQYNNPTDAWYYDYGTGSVGTFLKRVHTDYVTDTNYTNYTGSHIRSLPSQTWISSDSAGNNKVALSQIEYDNYASNSTHAALVPRSNVSGFDSTNYGAGFSRRGNPTAQTSYSNASTPSGAVSTYSQFDILGNVVKTIDANGNSNTIAYEDNFGSPDSNATTNSAPSQLSGANTFAFSTSYTNSLGTADVQYDYFTGAPVNTKDVNDVISKTIYGDDLDRPTQSVNAVGTGQEIQSTVVYDDANHRVEKTSDLNTLNDNLIKSVSFYDGLGRTTESRSYEADGDYRATQTQYDALSRPFKQSNPFRPTEIDGSHPILWTQSYFDSLGRVIKVKTPDNAEVNTSYSGNTVTVADQAEKLRRSITNALGQLIRIDEPNSSNQLGSLSSPNQATYYNYNTNGQMIRVQQGSQNRYFMYDSLGRMLRVKQPEQEVNTGLNTSGNPDNNSWSTGITYDNNNNVLTTTDAKGTTITSTYDALNRPVTRTYSDGTPSVTNYYDGTGLGSIPNFSKGKLTKVTSSISEARYTAFDVAGRLLESKQITDGQTYTSSYQYNISGALIQETYPSGRVVKSEFDSTGDLAKITSQKSGSSVYVPYVSNISYAASGAVSSLRLGNGKWETTKFNSRLQPTELGLGASATDTGLWKIVNEYGELQTNGTVTATKNSGSIGKQTLTIPGTSFVQGYKYDSLDRLTEAKETTGTTQNWIQQFGYDLYGNRTSLNQTVGSQQLTTTPSVDTSSNRFNANQGFAYDKNGNVTQDVDSVTSHTRQFVFNGDNKQTQVKDVTNNNHVVGTYYYDGENKRVKKVTDAETTVFVYSLGRIVAEYSTQLSEVPAINYTTTDHLGTPRIITDQFGQAKSRRDFMPFGEDLFVNVGPRTTGLKYGSSADDVRQKFTGYQKDAETSLDFAEARMYENRFGRFTAIDPLLASGRSANPQSFNRYSYSYNNPLRFSDPSGMVPGDYLDENLNYLGWDGTKDDKLYVVTDGKERDLIRKNEKQGGTTAMSAVSSALQLPSQLVRDAIGAAADRTKKPTADDLKGNFHEEAFAAGPAVNGGAETIVNAPPGAFADLSNPNVKVAESNPLGGNVSILADVTVDVHTHPGGKFSTAKQSSLGQTTIGGTTSTSEYEQSPKTSPTDFPRAGRSPFPNAMFIAVGVGNNKVYIHDSTRVKATLPLDKLRTIKARTR